MFEILFFLIALVALSISIWWIIHDYLTPIDQPIQKPITIINTGTVDPFNANDENELKLEYKALKLFEKLLAHQFALTMDTFLSPTATDNQIRINQWKADAIATQLHAIRNLSKTREEELKELERLSEESKS